METYHLDMGLGDNHGTTETDSHDSHAEIGADFGKSGYIASKIGYAVSQNETEEDMQGYQYGLTDLLKEGKPKLDETRKPEYYYRISVALTDYQLLGHNCVTTSVDPLFAGAQFDWIKDMSPAAQTLRLLRMAVSPYEVNNILKEDYREYHGTGLVSRIGQ